MAEILEFAFHPVWVLPTPEELRERIAKIGEEVVLGELKERGDKIYREQMDPLRYGVELEPIWRDARNDLKEVRDYLILGGNRSSKTEFAAKYAVEVLFGKGGAEIQCWSQNETTSIDRQQTYIYKYLPPEWRDVKRHGRWAKFNYKRSSGFTDRIIVTDEKSVVRFFTYQSFKADCTVAEGGECDLIWCDELAPYQLIQTLRYRLLTRGGLLLQTFTPYTGYSLVVQEYLDGARVMEWADMELLPHRKILGGKPGKIPYRMESYGGNRRIIFFHTRHNPYPDGKQYERLQADLKGALEAEVLTRAYGWPTKIIGVAFPRFNRDIHVIPHGRVPRVGTRYMVADPHGARNWFMLWVVVDPDDVVYVYREWPGIEFGPWAEPGEKPDGKVGPAQRANAGLGIVGYKKLIREIEGREKIAERMIDPKSGSTPHVTEKDEGVTIIDMLLEEHYDKDGKVVAEPMVFLPSPTCRDEEAAQLINDMLAYNPDEPISETNHPKVYISEQCPNLIYSMLTWTGVDKDKGACKDPVDCLKYLLKRGVMYTPENKGLCVTGKGY